MVHLSTGLSTVFRLSGLEDLTKAPEVILALKRMYRKKGRAQRQAIPLTRGVLAEWRERVGVNGLILLGVDIYDHIGSSLRPNSISRRLKELQKLAGLDLGGTLSGHSFRVGAALDLLERGESLDK